MNDPMRRIGAHDTGFWDVSNPILAKKEPIASDLSVDEAIEQAKMHEGSELVIVNAQGKASVHSLEIEDTFWDENKQVLLSELDRDPSHKVDSGKTPLAIDNNVAQAFSGQGAFLVDEKNKSTYLGDDVDQTSSKVKLQDAEAFLKNPTQSKVDAAYSIARDAGNEGHVDKALAQNVLNLLHQNYRQTGSAQNQIQHLHEGGVKSSVQDLIQRLDTLSGQESERVGALSQELKGRTTAYEKGLAAPTQAKEKARSAWNSAQRSESQKVEQAAYTLREARMPGVHALEKNLDSAKSTSKQKENELSTAVKRRVTAESDVRKLERLPQSAQDHLSQASKLESDNRNLYIQVQTYTMNTLSSLRSEIRQVDRDITEARYALREERNKPLPPVNDGGNQDPSKDPFAGDKQNTDGHSKDPFAGGGQSPDPYGEDPYGKDPYGKDPYGKDPFSGGGSGGSNKDPYSKDPFSGGGQNGDPYNKDPFDGNGGEYRNTNRIRNLESQVNLLEGELHDLEVREQSLNNISSRLTYTQDIDQIALHFYNLEPIDRTALGQYKERKDQNDRSIRSHKNTAASEQRKYDREINGARNTLASRVTSEETARAHFNQAQSNVIQLESNLSELKQNPRSDEHAGVKPHAEAYSNAVSHKEATVGESAPLTLKRNETQAAFDKYNSDYRNDKHSLESQINNVQQTLTQEARTEIQKIKSGL